jgi:N-acetylmuramoyl-L-alanine amidase
VLALVPEAEQILAAATVTPAAPAAAAATPLGTIVLDPGHGGTTTVGGSSPNNAISVSGVKEKKLTLEFCAVLAEEIREQAKDANESVTVIMTRTTDVNVGIKARANVARNNGAKLFVCLHFNGGASSARGTETFFRAASNGNTNLDEDVDFCEKVQASLFGTLEALDSGSKDRGVKPDTATNPGSLGVLRDSDLSAPGTNPKCRAAYVELEFITNNGVEKLLISGPNALDNRRKVMADLATTIRSYMRSF